jgi:hypothetical protein
MSKNNTGPSEAWRHEIFTSPPRRDIDKKSKSTTRVPIYIPSLGRYAFAEGGNEASALLLLKYLQTHGFVSRIKEQAFALDELKGPVGRVPDILVELKVDKSLHIIQCKSKRFMTEEVKQRFDTERLFVEPRGFNFHIWTDRDYLANPTSESVRLIDRGFRFPPSVDVLKQIEQKANQVSTLGPLIEKFGWDDSLAAAAHGAFYLNVMEKIHEKSAITSHFSDSNYLHLFARRTASGGWWESLAA